MAKSCDAPDVGGRSPGSIFELPTRARVSGNRKVDRKRQESKANGKHQPFEGAALDAEPLVLVVKIAVEKPHRAEKSAESGNDDA